MFTKSELGQWTVMEYAAFIIISGILIYAIPKRNKIIFDIANNDTLIRYWYAKSLIAKNERDMHIATASLDAYQQVRIMHGLKIFPTIIQMMVVHATKTTAIQIHYSEAAAPKTEKVAHQGNRSAHKETEAKQLFQLQQSAQKQEENKAQ